jgi:hypothetical protein
VVLVEHVTQRGHFTLHFALHGAFGEFANGVELTDCISSSQLHYGAGVHITSNEGVGGGEQTVPAAVCCCSLCGLSLLKAGHTNDP